MYGGQVEVHTGFRLGYMRERDQSEELGIDWMDLQEVELEGMDWIYLVRDRDS
jgi:hypothetical protein